MVLYKMGRHLRPLKVHQNASIMLQTGRLNAEPLWYRTVGAIPPTTTLVRSMPVQLYERKLRKSARKPSRMFQPQNIIYPEDELRTDFFKDHPWELARPRVLVETDVKDHLRYDWSHIQQKGKQLDGESVVQRQIWLMENEGMQKEQAYDKARKEFYDLRMQEDIERRIAQEEALAVGAKFGKSYIEVGLELEQKALESWKARAVDAMALRKGRAAAFAGNAEIEESSGPVSGELAEAGGEVKSEGAVTAPVRAA